MSLDLTHAEYRRGTFERITQSVEALTVSSSGKYSFYCQHGTVIVKPNHYSGYTVIADPYPTPNLQSFVSPIVTTLAESVAGFVPVPIETLHMTVADLVSGARYVAIEQRGRTRELEDRVTKLLSAWGSDQVIGHVCGIGSFPSVIVAIVDFEDSVAYNRIVDLRDTIYTDPNLASLGVSRVFPFQGHITLGYLETAPARNLDQKISELRMQNRFGLAVPITCPSLYRFPNMSKYERIGP